MTLREANALAVELYGSGAYCESVKGRRTLSIKGARRTRLRFNFPPRTPWEQVFDATALLRHQEPEGT